MLETEGYNHCGRSVYVESRSAPGVLDVDVRGASIGSGCDGLVALRWSVAISGPLPLDVSVRHEGATDRYRIVAGDTGLQIVALETSTTRLGPR